MSYKIVDEQEVCLQDFQSVKNIELGVGRKYCVLYNEEPYLSVNVDFFSVFTDAVVFGDYLFVGNYTDGMYIVCLKNFIIKEMAVDGYFGYFEKNNDVLYVLGCSNIIAFDKCAQMIWQSENIAIDGVTFQKIENDMMYVECEMDPWLSYDSLNIELPDGYLFFAPIVNWGKYREENGKLMMPVSVRLNHAIADGFLVANVFRLLEKEIGIFCYERRQD